MDFGGEPAFQRYVGEVLCFVLCFSAAYFFLIHFTHGVKSLDRYRRINAQAKRVRDAPYEFSYAKPSPTVLNGRWWVSTGTHQEGPFTAREIAVRLFSQDLDFDSLCWPEHLTRELDGKSIADAGIFVGSQESSASLWCYDCDMIQGPVSPAFMRRALSQGSISTSSYVCEGTTVQGWKPLEECDPSWFPSYLEVRSKDAVLRDSLVPPSGTVVPKPAPSNVIPIRPEAKLNSAEGEEQDPMKKAA